MDGEKIQIWAPFSNLAEVKASWNMDLLMKMSKMAQVPAYLAYDTWIKGFSLEITQAVKHVEFNAKAVNSLEATWGMNG